MLQEATQMLEGIFCSVCVYEYVSVVVLAYSLTYAEIYIQLYGYTWVFFTFARKLTYIQVYKLWYVDSYHKNRKSCTHILYLFFPFFYCFTFLALMCFAIKFISHLRRMWWSTSYLLYIYIFMCIFIYNLLVPHAQLTSKLITILHEYCFTCSKKQQNRLLNIYSTVTRCKILPFL